MASACTKRKHVHVTMSTYGMPYHQHTLAQLQKCPQTVEKINLPKTKSSTMTRLCEVYELRNLSKTLLLPPSTAVDPESIVPFEIEMQNDFNIKIRVQQGLQSFRPNSLAQKKT
uniref:Uncharacterized protein n=1 Tax=Nelumbo nucifera TaxID=4432 RepID=A0A822ZVR2_NELNU|nr:TPA_asm: hypothetical protein HUJ06_017558 [Nelumbo nucifera]